MSAMTIDTLALVHFIVQMYKTDYNKVILNLVSTMKINNIMS